VQKMRLNSLWANAVAQGQEAVWLSLPDQALELVQAEQRRATPEDLQFLASMAKQSQVEAVAAVRLLASFGEDSLAPVDQVRALLFAFLEHHDPIVRLEVVGGLWQMADRASAPHLADVFLEEDDPAVSETIEHVLRLFQGQRNDPR
jgi:hypothetical protein